MKVAAKSCEIKQEKKKVKEGQRENDCTEVKKRKQ